MNSVPLTIFLTVPPGNPILMDKKGKMITTPLYGPFDEGTSLTLTCKTNGGKNLFELKYELLWLQ